VQGRHAEQTSDAIGAAALGVGPTAKAWASWLHYGLGLSFVKTSALLGRLGINVSAGALCQSAQSTSATLVPVQSSIESKVNEQAMVVPDESGWRVGGESAWLFTAATKAATAYWVADGRGYEEACEVISPEFSGFMVRDGCAPYRKFDKATHQTCLAHLLRRCHEMTQSLPRGDRHVPEKVKAILTEALDARDLKPRRRKAVVADLAERVEMLADDAHPNDENRRLVKHLYAEREALFTFQRRRRRHELASRASHPTSGRESQSLGRQQDVAGSCHSGADDERHPHGGTAGPRRDRVPQPASPAHPTRRALRCYSAKSPAHPRSFAERR
jgi:hypothetical protein